MKNRGKDRESKGYSWKIKLENDKLNDKLRVVMDDRDRGNMDERINGKKMPF